MKATELRERTKQFALRVIKLVAALPENRFGDVMGRQLLRSATSVGANYHEAIRASSRKQFIYSAEIALREADESSYWMELIAGSETIEPSRLIPLQSECSELIAILAATVRTSKRNNNAKSNPSPKLTDPNLKSEIPKSEI